MYNWSRSPTEVHADAPGTGYITLTDETTKTVVGDSDIVATNLKTFSTATIANRDFFTAKPYTLSLTVTDIQSGETGIMSFTGQIDGWLTASSSFLRNTFTGDLTKTLLLGNNRYTATIGPYTPPGPPGSTNSGSISSEATVKVQTVVEELPEPGSLALSGLGVMLLAVSRWRGRRRSHAG
jgi:hypothetical protein